MRGSSPDFVLSSADIVRRMEEKARSIRPNSEAAVDQSLHSDADLVQLLQGRCERLLNEFAARKFQLPGCYWNDGRVTLEWHLEPKIVSLLSIYSDVYTFLIVRGQPHKLGECILDAEFGPNEPASWIANQVVSALQ
jgi:hypothetical protein